MTKRMKRLVAVARAAATTWWAERAQLRAFLRIEPAPATPPPEPLESRVFLTAAHTLIGLDAFRLDPRFKDIDGSGTDIVIIDGNFDLKHTDFLDPGKNSRIRYSFDFGDNDADAHNVNDEHGT